MSERQNIYTNASIFGLTRKEIDARMEKIISFSELEEFIDNPVRTYSSGMYMRLAFSVAINVNADILLIDEILAVGDAAFQDKCFKKLLEIKGKGTTIVIVSHSLEQIESICERSIWIHDGKIREEGVPQEVHSKYLEFMGQKEKSGEPEAQPQEQPQEQQEEPQEEQQKITEIENDKIEEGEPDVITALDMDKILGEIKHEIEEKQFKLDEVDFEDIPIIQHVDDKIEMQDTFSAENYEKEFRIMKSRWGVPDTPQFTSNNPVSQAAKYIVRKLSRCVVVPLVTMQNAFNYSIVRLNGQVRNYIKENEKEKENMQKRIDELEKMLEEIKKNQEKAQ
ncbi:MAG: ABC transporter ATP-binding protein, partial [Eubacterium sp.]